MRSNNQSRRRSDTSAENVGNTENIKKQSQPETVIRDCIQQNQQNECVELTCDNFYEIIRNFPKSYMILFVTSQTTKEHLLPVIASIIEKYFNK